METKEAFRIALQSLWANKLRTVLTLLGVVISVASLIAVVTLINGAQVYVATKVNKHATTKNVMGSVALIPKSKPDINRVNPSAPSSPRATPIKAIFAPCPRTMRKMSRRCAPSAMRIPNSRVRWLTR